MRCIFYVLLSLLLIHPVLHAKELDCKQHHWVVVIDAGSSGSRAHLYSYDTNETKDPIHITELWHKKINPGITSIEPNANTLDAYFSILLAGIPEQQSLPVFFYATAGMRLVPQTKQQHYYQEIKRWFNQRPQWQLQEAKTITGNEEGLYDWLAVNYHIGAFSSAQQMPVGVMDMGGASVQIAFPITEASQKDYEKAVHFQLYGQQYHLFIHSFLGLGQIEVSHQFLDSTACFSITYPLPDGDKGQGDALQCEQEVSTLMNNVHKVNQTIQPLLQANPISHWYAIGGISNLAHSAPFHFTNHQFTSQALIKQGDEDICHQQWDTLSNQYPKNEYLYGYCLFTAYYYALMVDGYGISAEQPIRYLPPESDVDWTLGVVLLQGR